MKSGTTRNLVLASLFAALTALGAFLRIPFGLSAITLQFFVTAMAGVLLGAKYGALSQAVYVALGLIGLPIFTQGGGLSYLAVPSCGFLFGLIPAAALIGALTKGNKTAPRVFLASLAGLVVLYAVGLPYMAVVLNVFLGKALPASVILMTGMVVYLPGDFAKLVAVTCLSKPLQRALS